MPSEFLHEVLQKLGIDNPNPQGQDSLDFHDIHISNLVEALEDAYFQGKRDARRENY